MHERGGEHSLKSRSSWSLGLAALLCGTLLAGAALSAEPPPVETVLVAQDTNAPADLIIANRTIVTLRAPVMGASPAERAEAIGQRIEALLAEGGTPVVSLVPIDGGYMLNVHGKAAFRVLDADVDPESNLTTRQLAEETSEHFSQALAEVAEARNARTLLPAIGWTVLATLLLGIVLWVIGRSFRWLAQRVRTMFERRAQQYGSGWLGHLLGAAGPAALVNAPLRVVAWLLVLFCVYTWTGFVLQRFPYTRPWGEALRENLLNALGEIGSAVLHAVPGLLFVALIVVLARLSARVVRAFFETVHQGRVKLAWVDETTARPTGRIISWAIWLFALVAAYPYIPGSDSEAFKGLGVFVGLMLSIGSSGIVNQAVSGLMLMYTRALRPGEFVRIADTEGTVTTIGFLTTRIETLRHEEISIPNAVIAANITRNYSRLATEGGLRIATKLTIGYDVPWRQVHAMLVLAAGRTAGIVHEAEPRVLQTALLDFYVEYTLLVTIADPARRAMRLSELHAHIQDVFNENGVQIMSPNYEADPEAPKVVASADWFRSPAPRDVAGAGTRPPDGIAVE